jgi:hypothetical protein
MSQDSSTYQSPQHVARMSFLAIRRFEGYQRTVLDRVSAHKKGDRRTLFPHFATVRDPGWSSGSLSRKSRRANLRTNSRTFSGSLPLVQRPYWIEDRVSLRVIQLERLDKPRLLTGPCQHVQTPEGPARRHWYVGRTVTSPSVAHITVQQLGVQQIRTTGRTRT